MNVLNYKKPLSTNQSSRIAKLIFLIILLLLMNCNTVWAYTKDRKNDFFDIVTIGFNIGIGVEAHIGPVPLGAGGFVGGGLSNGCWASHNHASFLILGKEELDCEWEERSRNKDLSYDYGLWNDKRLSDKNHLFTRMEITGGFGVSPQIGFNPGELLDFFVGFFGFDLYHDDMYNYQILTETIGEKNMNIIRKYYSE